MGRKLADFKQLVDSSGDAFYEYLKLTEDDFVMNFIEEVGKLTKVFIFSGVIRNFFLGEKNNRDIDIILGNQVDFQSLLMDVDIKENSFGGFKILHKNTTIDLWYLENTWAFKNDHMAVFDFALETKVPGTAFFNFSSIIYSVDDQMFYYTENFLTFLKDQQIDYVYEKNPNYKLCLVNTLYYSDKYKLNIKDSLKKYIVDIYNQFDKNYVDIQLKHFGRVIYMNDQIEHRIQTIFLPRRKFKKRRILPKI